MRRSERIRRNDEGAFAVVFALLFIAIVGFSALAVDVGYWYASKRQLQTAADSAALAGCRDLAVGRSNTTIWSTVEDYAARNFSRPLTLVECRVISPATGGLSEIGKNYVKVTVESDSPAFLSRVLGQNRVKIDAQSTFEVRLYFRPDQVRVEIEDHGVGFDASGVTDSRVEQIGLRSIRQRVDREGGRFSIASSPGEGTTVVVELPLEGNR